jgi:hypothetical protein
MMVPICVSQGENGTFAKAHPHCREDFPGRHPSGISQFRTVD